MAAAVVLAAVAVVLGSPVLFEWQAQKNAWAMACAFSQYDCSDQVPPLVDYNDPEVQKRDILGLYDARRPGIISITPEVKGTMEGLFVMVHEMTHYLQDSQHGGPIKYPTNKATACENEAEAHKVAFEAEKAVGLSKTMKDWTPLRQLEYGCLPINLLFPGGNNGR